MDSTLRTRSTRAAAGALLLVVLATALGACSYSSTTAAHSGPATLGVPQAIGLWDCGEVPSGPTVVDFDESLWLPVGADPYELASPPVDGDGPADTGTMTLLAPGRAEYRSDRGPVFTFERHGDEFTFEGCVPWASPLDEA
jgi:hypothetical protein